MGLKSIIAKPVYWIAEKKINKWKNNPIKTQEKWFKTLIDSAKNTEFGKDHNFKNIKSYKDFKANVPVRDYEKLKSYIDKVVQGKSNILWKDIPLYFAKTSGTTSGSKYIPISKESIPYHIQGAKNALLSYMIDTKKTDFVDGKVMFLQGTPKLEEKNGVQTGRLSGISAHYVPNYLQKNRMPSWDTNLIEDWETKVETVIDETITEDMRLISGIPPWLQMYFERIVKRTGKPIKDVFPNFNLMVTGGVNYEPYRSTLENLIGKSVDIVQTYPASEGFIAFQDTQKNDDLLLYVDSGIFYEFIPVDEFHNQNPTRICLEDIELHKDYAIILNTNAGLWGYNIGDTVQFTSLNPYRIIVSGRIKHYISAFGEHVIGHEVEYALQETLKNQKALVKEFTVAPQVKQKKGLPYHQWFIEFEQEPENKTSFIEEIDKHLQHKNSYYKDLIQGKVLQKAKLISVSKNGFNNYMKSIGKLGGQNKVPRLSNDRKIADKLLLLQNIT